MNLSSELMASRDQVRRQQRIIFGLAAALRTERAASSALIDLLDTLLGDLNG